MSFTKTHNIPSLTGFLDFEKAFDSIEWNWLSTKTSGSIQFRPATIGWFRTIEDEQISDGRLFFYRGTSRLRRTSRLIWKRDGHNFGRKSRQISSVELSVYFDDVINGQNLTTLRSKTMSAPFSLKTTCPSEATSFFVQKSRPSVFQCKNGHFYFRVKFKFSY